MFEGKEGSREALSNTLNEGDLQTEKRGDSEGKTFAIDGRCNEGRQDAAQFEILGVSKHARREGGKRPSIMRRGRQEGKG